MEGLLASSVPEETVCPAILLEAAYNVSELPLLKISADPILAVAV